MKTIRRYVNNLIRLLGGQPTFIYTRGEARAAFLTALRSGRYVQATDSLCAIRKDGKIGHCCLGVACEVFRQLEGRLALHRRRYFDDDKSRMQWVFGSDALMLPAIVMDWLGINAASGKTDSGDSLTGYNDHLEYSFNQIANIIESNPTGLFKD